MKTANNLVSIIVPCYNKGKYLSETLDSVIRQTYQHWECIIINDGSTDDTENIALLFCKTDSRFKYLYQENQGVITARNNAVKASTGTYLLPLDGDDMLAPTFLEKTVSVLDYESNVKVVACRVNFFDGIQGEMALKEYTIQNLLVCNCMVCSCLFRRTDFDRIGGYNLNMSQGWEDWDFWLSLLENGGEVYKLNEVLFYYRITTGSRNDGILKNKDQLQLSIAQNHVPLLYREYLKLYESYHSIVLSRSYRLAHKYSTFAKKLYSFLRLGK